MYSQPGNMAAVRCLPTVLVNFHRMSTKRQLFQVNNLKSVAPILHRKSIYTDTGQENGYDVVVVGGGIVGLATARELSLRRPDLKLAVIEKEDKVAAHQSGKNSGVIHAGIYYTPGSLKAKLCVEGLKLMYKYCDDNNVPYKKCGKLVVATSAEELPRLENLHKRGLKNDVPELRVIEQDQIREIEPHCRGIRALHSPQTGIVDFAAVTRSYADNFTAFGGKIHLGFKVTDFSQSELPNFPVLINGTSSHVFGIKKRIHARCVIVCGGLHADRLAASSGCSLEPRVVPFRGDYLLLRPEKTNMVRGNIYPVPDPRFPFLGIHFTPRMNGDVWLGPTAVLAFKREGYNLQDFSVRDLLEALSYRGLQKLIFRNLLYAVGEFHKGISMEAQTKGLRKFIPEIKVSDVMRGPAGVRAMAMNLEGNLVEDFVFDTGDGVLGRHMLHVRNAPSPAATSSLAIAKMVIDKAENSFEIL